MWPTCQPWVTVWVSMGSDYYHWTVTSDIEQAETARTFRELAVLRGTLRQVALLCENLPNDPTAVQVMGLVTQAKADMVAAADPPPQVPMRPLSTTPGHGDCPPLAPKPRDPNAAPKGPRWRRER